MKNPFVKHTPGSGAGSANPGKPLIAIIDDEEDVCHLLALALEARGFATEYALDGESGLALIRRRRPAAVIMDIMMPVMNGYQALAKMQQDPKLATIPAIVLSSIDAEGQKTASDWADRLQVARFIPKPLDAEQVAEAVAQIVSPTE